MLFFPSPDENEKKISNQDLCTEMKFMKRRKVKDYITLYLFIHIANIWQILKNTLIKRKYNCAIVNTHFSVPVITIST